MLRVKIELEGQPGPVIQVIKMIFAFLIALPIAGGILYLLKQLIS